MDTNSRKWQREGTTVFRLIEHADRGVINEHSVQITSRPVHSDAAAERLAETIKTLLNEVDDA